MATVLIPLPSRDFDPTEAGVPWRELSARGHEVRFATPDGNKAQADPRMVHGTGLGPLRSLLRADENGRADSVLRGRKTTALTRHLELTAWALTVTWLGSYYRTYPETVQSEVTRALASAADFDAGPLALRRDSPEHPEYGFTVCDGNYLSARWPGDAHLFALHFARMLAPTHFPS
jgi:hypothetical protein